MIGFFKNLFSKDGAVKRDVILLDAYAAQEENDGDVQEEEESCAPRGKCGGCGCR